VPREVEGPAQADADDADVQAVQARSPAEVPFAWSRDQELPQLASSTPEPVSPIAPALALTPSSIYDIDRLWDWCRDDPQGTHAFLGIAPEHSRHLQDHIGKLLTLESQGVAWLRTIHGEGTPIGFVSLLPVHRDVAAPYGDAHCYLMPALQGHLPTLLPGILAEASRQEPTLTFRVFTPDYAFAKLLQPHGFALTIVLTRPASTSQNR